MSEMEVADYDGRAAEPLEGLDSLPTGVREAVETAEIRSRFDVMPGTVVDDPVLAVDELVFHEGGDLTLGKSGSPFAVLWANHVHFHNGRVQSTVRVAPASPVDGSVGSAGTRGSNGRSWGDHGAAGSDGGAGTDGAKSAAVPNLVLFAGSITFDSSPSPGSSPLALVAAGIDGGDGGSGGNGGAGGNGHQGRPGTEEVERGGDRR